MARKLSFWEGIKAQFSTKCLVLIPIAVESISLAELCAPHSSCRCSST